MTGTADNDLKLIIEKLKNVPALYIDTEEEFSENFLPLIDYFFDHIEYLHYKDANVAEKLGSELYQVIFIDTFAKIDYVWDTLLSLQENSSEFFLCLIANNFDVLPEAINVDYRLNKPFSHDEFLKLLTNISEKV